MYKHVDIIKFEKHFLNSTTLILVKYNIGLKTLLQQGLPEPIFYGDLVYEFKIIVGKVSKVRKGAKIRYGHNQVPYLTQDTNGKVTNSQLDTTHEGQEVSSF